MEHLQLLRRLAADGLVGQARQALAAAETALLARQQALAQAADTLQLRRAAQTAAAAAQPLSIAALQCWRQEEAALLAGLARRRDAVHAQHAAIDQARRELQLAQQQRRQLEARREKFTQLLEQLRTAD
ncbi:hypothetical protein [Pseudoduganella sp. R-34]